MGLRITTWNVNGIRNPFQYQPWRDKRTFEAMFDILEADIVVFQETKIQRKDLRDDMVLVPGWDCYWSLPKHKKGYAGVVIYTRNSTCAPIRAEEGITGVLCPPSSPTSFKDLPGEESIGGYPNADQLSTSNVDPLTLDSEGRCVILEFPLFVILGVYSPAMRDESRDDFRLGFLNLLDARIRNLVAMGKRVILAGDLNISRDERDSANAEESMRKHGLGGQEFVSTPSRRLFNQLLDGGKVFGKRDDGREQPVMWDICRGFHDGRRGMFTCWETKINARPGNFGSRIDYVICSVDMKDWFEDSNIQEGLMGSDHCPVYATLKDKVPIDGVLANTLDAMNPAEMFVDGKRMREWTTKNLLPMSGKLIPEFDRRKSIKDMFSQKPTLQKTTSASFDAKETTTAVADTTPTPSTVSEAEETASLDASQDAATNMGPPETLSSAKSNGAKKRSLTNGSSATAGKKPKFVSTPSDKTVPTKGQKSLMGFFKPKSTTQQAKEIDQGEASLQEDSASQAASDVTPQAAEVDAEEDQDEFSTQSGELKDSVSVTSIASQKENNDIIDPIASKDSWSKLFNKRSPPRCESHDEPCISYVTKKPGINCGRSFWLCPRPLGPSGNKEKGTQWRCPTFIWASEWNGSSSSSSG